MKYIFSFLLVINVSVFAQIQTSDKVFLTFEKSSGETNVNGPDAIDMLRPYIENKTTLEVVNSIEEADYTIFTKNQDHSFSKEWTNFISGSECISNLLGKLIL